MGSSEIKIKERSIIEFLIKVKGGNGISHIENQVRVLLLM
jgi:hypothetical protein